jgi:hypothetical protein
MAFIMTTLSSLEQIRIGLLIDDQIDVPQFLTIKNHRW